MTKPRLAVDFDGTIFDGVGLFPGCVEALHELRTRYTIGIFSARPTDAERVHMVNVLDDHGVPYDEIMPIKPDAVFYLDDKGRQFQGWDKLTI